MIEGVAVLAVLLVLLPVLAGYACMGLVCLAALPAAVHAGLFVPRSVRAGERQRNPRRGRDIPARLRRRIMAADRRRCVACGSRLRPQVDHFFPHDHGGLPVPWNLFVLCQPCNQAKSDYWVWPSGDVSYHARAEHWDPSRAAAILARERAKRWRPARWLRMAVAR